MQNIVNSQKLDGRMVWECGYQPETARVWSVRPSPIPEQRDSMLCVSLPAAVATELGNELFMAAAAVGHTMSSMVEQVASTQGTDSARNMV